MSKFRLVGRIAVIGVLAAVVLFFVGGGWWASSVLRDELLVPSEPEREFDLEILAVGSGRAVLSRSDLSATDGIWGVASATAYGQVSTVAEVNEDRVERSFRAFDGDFQPGDAVTLDQYAFPPDPLEAHGIAFEDVVVPTADGVLPAWLIDGQRNTWVIFVHGKGIDERRQVLRILPTLADDDLPVLAITYRNDLDAPPSSTGLRHWGLEEWMDVDAAMRFAQSRGAENFVLVGYGMGASLVSMTLHESDLTSQVKGVIYDSPVLSFEAAADAAAERRSIPGALRGIGKSLLALRFEIDWERLDQVRRSAEFDVPMLLIQGSLDDVAPAPVAEAMAEALPDLITLRSFDAGHLFPWNSDPGRYENAVAAFLTVVNAP